ncbi:MAG: cupin domain-containing protein [Betaproteobacteria bacterium]|nr:cupin domain-containing protein [Betaproteobacteria bacterium]
MKKTKLRLTKEFAVVLGNRRAQAAEMVLRPGDKEGDSRNRHRGADQWLFVVSGEGVAIVNGKRHRLSERSLLLIEHGDEHEIRQVGEEPLRTLNIYVPPAYDKKGEPLPRGSR